MEFIFHEKQEGSLCAQHCLNALLQGPYFTAVDLGTLAQSLDDEERSRMAESGLESEEYQRFLAQPSGNMDDSGYFSIQVISKALQVWGLDLLPFSSQEEHAVVAQQCPSAMTSFICNYRDHWFSIRKLGNQWFNLNSLLSRPQLISDTYLAMFLAQLQQEGYSIFIVRGTLPDCPADKALLICPYVPPPKQAATAARGRAVSATSDDEDLQAALALSLAEQEAVAGTSTLKFSREVSSEDDELQAALVLSLQRDCKTSKVDDAVLTSLSVGSSVNSKREKLEVDQNDLEKALQLSLNVKNDTEGGQAEKQEDELEKALKLSLECVEAKEAEPVDPEEIRRKRLAFLESTNKKS